MHQGAFPSIFFFLTSFPAIFFFLTSPRTSHAYREPPPTTPDTSPPCSWSASPLDPGSTIADSPRRSRLRRSRRRFLASVVVSSSSSPSSRVADISAVASLASRSCGWCAYGLEEIVAFDFGCVASKVLGPPASGTIIICL